MKKAQPEATKSISKSLKKHTNLANDNSAKVLPSTSKWYNKRLYATALALNTFYLLIFQFKFFTSGDSWAEAYYEYVHGAIANSWPGFFYTGIAGYFNFIPKFLSFGYVSAGLPVGKIDYFFRLITIIFTVACVSFIAHSYNRHLIKNDYARLFLSFLVLMTFYHISSFSFINVWYVGFIPIILVSLHPKKFTSELYQLAYVSFALAFIMTKPSLVLLPLILYRTIRHKEYLLGYLLTLAIGLQSALFFTSSYYRMLPAMQHVNIIKKIINVFLYTALVPLKFFRLGTPGLPLLFLSALAIGATGFVILRYKGKQTTVLLFGTLFITSYTAIYSPDAAPVLSVKKSISLLYHDDMKLQREILITFLILVLFFMAADSLYRLYHAKLKIAPRFVYAIAVIVALVLGLRAYRPIDTQSARLYIDIDPYRSNLQENEPVCMPIPPTPYWLPYDYNGGPTYGWYFENRAYGSCTKSNYEKSIDYSAFSSPISTNTSITLTGKPEAKIRSILLPVNNKTPGKEVKLTLTNASTGKSYSANIKAKSNEEMLNFVAFNLDQEDAQDTYTYKVTTHPSDTIYQGHFTDGSSLIFGYFLTE